MHFRFSFGGDGFDPCFIAAALFACFIALVAFAALVWR